MSFSFGFSLPAWVVLSGGLASLNALLQEDGFGILQEDGFYILLES